MKYIFCIGKFICIFLFHFQVFQRDLYTGLHAVNTFTLTVIIPVTVITVDNYPLIRFRKRLSCSRSASHLSHPPPIIKIPDPIRKQPSYGDSCPDSGYSDPRNSGKDVCQNDAASKGCRSQDDRHARFFDCSVEAVEQEEKTDQEVKAAFNSQIAYTYGEYLRLLGFYKQQEKWFCEDKDACRY